MLVGVPASGFALAPVTVDHAPARARRPALGVLNGVPTFRRPSVASPGQRTGRGDDRGLLSDLCVDGIGRFRERVAGELDRRLEHVLERRSLGVDHDLRRRPAARGHRRSASHLRGSHCRYQNPCSKRSASVEDQLAALRILSEEAAIQRRAVDASERSLQQATLRYRGGLASYLEVTVAQSVALQNERARSGCSRAG